MIKTFIKREIYLSKIKPFVNKNIIKILIGQRRVGKSYILYQIIDYIKNNIHGVKEKDILYINKELLEFDEIKNYQDLIKYVESKVQDQNQKYLFIDEIQDIEFFEKALRDLQARGNFDIYCTGSNANLLSVDLATQLSGRYIEIEVFPLTYNEFLDFHKLTSSKEVFYQYLKFGGLPYLIHLNLEADIVYDYLKNVYNTIILKDVITRYGIRNIHFLEYLIQFLATQTGSIISAKKISDFLKSNFQKISPNIVLQYMQHLCSVYLINKVDRFDVKGKKIFEIGHKYYFTDLGLLHTITPFAESDISRILENVVYNHLRVHGYQLSVGYNQLKEIDLVCKKQNNLIYIQVAYLMPDQKTKEREFGNLLEIPDNYDKYVLSMDDVPIGNYQGIKHMNIIDFLKDWG